MAFLRRLGGWLRRLVGPPRPRAFETERAGRLADLLTGTSPIETVSAAISDHVARIVVADPLPQLDESVESRLLEAAWRALREHPAEGPMRVLEVWAPREPGRPPERALRREFKETLEVPPQPSARTGPAHPEPHFARLPDHPPGAPGPLEESADHGMRPLREFLHLPERLQARLRARGVDPSAFELSRLVEGLLGEAGYGLVERREEGRVADLEVSSDAGRVLVRCYQSGGHVLPATIDRFAFRFLSSGADEGFFITDGLLGFESRHWERDHRIHLLDRVGLQRLIDAVAARRPTAASP